jgi:hypothetical protein
MDASTFHLPDVCQSNGVAWVNQQKVAAFYCGRSAATRRRSLHVRLWGGKLYILCILLPLKGGPFGSLVTRQLVSRRNLVVAHSTHLTRCPRRLRYCRLSLTGGAAALYFRTIEPALARCNASSDRRRGALARKRWATMLPGIARSAKLPADCKGDWPQGISAKTAATTAPRKG